MMMLMTMTWAAAAAEMASDDVTTSVVNVTSHAASANCSDVDGLKRLTHGEIWTPEVTQRVATLVALMVLTLVGNLAVIGRLAARRLCRRHHHHRGHSAVTAASNHPSRVNVFIVNLAIGDLAVCCFTMTTEVLFVVFEKNWVLGAAACRLLLYIQVPNYLILQYLNVNI